MAATELSRFMSIPLEMRYQIYGQIDRTSKSWLSILGVSKEIREEAMPILFGKLHLLCNFPAEWWAMPFKGWPVPTGSQSIRPASFHMLEPYGRQFDPGALLGHPGVQAHLSEATVVVHAQELYIPSVVANYYARHLAGARLTVHIRFAKSDLPMSSTVSVIPMTKAAASPTLEECRKLKQDLQAILLDSTTEFDSESDLATQVCEYFEDLWVAFRSKCSVF